MIVKSTKQMKCKKCKKKITIREYEGLEGSWWTDHFACIYKGKKR